MAGERPTQAVLVERLSNIEDLIKELKGVVLSLEQRLSGVERIETGCQALSGSRMDTFEKQVDGLELRVKKLEDAVIDLVQTNKILRWILGVLTALSVAIVIAIARGEISLVMR